MSEVVSPLPPLIASPMPVIIAPSFIIDTRCHFFAAASNVEYDSILNFMAVLPSPEVPCIESWIQKPSRSDFDVIVALNFISVFMSWPPIAVPVHVQVPCICLSVSAISGAGFGGVIAGAAALPDPGPGACGSAFAGGALGSAFAAGVSASAMPLIPTIVSVAIATRENVFIDVSCLKSARNILNVARSALLRAGFRFFGHLAAKLGVVS